MKQHIALLTCVVLAATMLLGSCAGKPKAAPQPVAKRSIAPRNEQAPYDGIDISSHQGDIDWDKVSQDKNIRFVYIKATEGASYRSPHYSRNITLAKSHGILVGSYHYLRTTSTMRAQFNNFLQVATVSSQDLIPMIDVEELGSWSRKQIIDSVKVFAALITQRYGVKPMIYSTMAFYNRNLAPHFNKYPLYIGRYSATQPSIAWNGYYTIWQFSETGIIPGIDAYVDLCHYRDDAWLDEIAMPARSTETSS